MNEKLAKIKSKIQEHSSEIIAATITAAGFITYIMLDKKSYAHLPKGEYSVLELPHEWLVLMTEEDVHPFYDIFGHTIHVHYNQPVNK